MKSEVRGTSLLGHLQWVQDARQRAGKIYLLWSSLGMLVLAALNGQRTLRSMWLWYAKCWGNSVFYVRNVSYGEDRSHTGSG